MGLQSYSRDLLAFLFILLTLVAAVTSRTPFRTPPLLNRGQTEEWKGWMQAPPAPPPPPPPSQPDVHDSLRLAC